MLFDARAGAILLRALRLMLWLGMRQLAVIYMIAMLMLIIRFTLTPPLRAAAVDTPLPCCFRQRDIYT